MPILAPEPDLFPSDALNPSGDGREWLVAQSKPRQEKSLARDLHTLNVPYYSPCTPRRNRIRGRIVISSIPLFAGYVFVKATREERGVTLRTRRVRRLLDVNDQNRLLHDLRQVRTMLGLGLPLEAIDLPAVGEVVRIRSGPMIGLVGSVLREAGKKRFVVSVDFLGKGVAVELAAESLVRLPRRAVA